MHAQGMLKALHQIPRFIGKDLLVGATDTLGMLS